MAWLGSSLIKAWGSHLRLSRICSHHPEVQQNSVVGLRFRILGSWHVVVAHSSSGRSHSLSYSFLHHPSQQERNRCMYMWCLHALTLKCDYVHGVCTCPQMCAKSDVMGLKYLNLTPLNIHLKVKSNICAFVPGLTFWLTRKFWICQRLGTLEFYFLQSLITSIILLNTEFIGINVHKDWGMSRTAPAVGVSLIIWVGYNGLSSLIQQTR